MHPSWVLSKILCVPLHTYEDTNLSALLFYFFSVRQGGSKQSMCAFCCSAWVVRLVLTASACNVSLSECVINEMWEETGPATASAECVHTHITKVRRTARVSARCKIMRSRRRFCALALCRLVSLCARGSHDHEALAVRTHSRSPSKGTARCCWWWWLRWHCRLLRSRYWERAGKKRLTRRMWDAENDGFPTPVAMATGAERQISLNGAILCWFGIF